MLRGKAGSERVRTPLVTPCQSADPEIEPHHVPACVVHWADGAAQRHDAEAAVGAAARRAWTLMTALDSNVPVPHDAYLTLCQLDGQRFAYDVILYDEAQDANPAMLGLLL